MVAKRIHLVRHGEVHNPRRILYGRLPGFRLSTTGVQLARQAAAHLADRPIVSLVASPLQRCLESASPIAAEFGLAPTVDERVIEPWNAFEGKRMKIALLNPLNWWHLRNRALPSWGEPFADVAARMTEAIEHHAAAVPDDAELVIVSHQMPIWTTTLALRGEPLAHDPRSRRCALSSVTSFEKQDGRWVEVDYFAPEADTVDVGAV